MELRIYTRGQMKAAVRAAKAEGRKEAEEFLQERIALTKNIIQDCVEEIFRLDKEYPVTGVIIPYAFAEKVERKLRKEGGVIIPERFLRSLIQVLKKHNVNNYAAGIKNYIEDDIRHPLYADRLKEYMLNSNPIDLDKEEVLKVIEEMTKV